MHGKLRIDQSDGSYESYHGQISNDMVNGKGTLFKFSSFNRKQYQYTGEFKNNKKHGHGQYTENDKFGVSYYGQWKENVYHGYGELCCETCVESSYFGQWKDGQKHGFGKCYFSEYDVPEPYEGGYNTHIYRWMERW